MDGIILTSIGWTKKINKSDIFKIINDLIITKNDEGFSEISFKNEFVAQRVLELNEVIDEMCHEYFDNYMMELLAEITRLSIDKGYITYLSLYRYTEEELFNILNQISDIEIQNLLLRFRTIKIDDIPEIKLLNVKKRLIKPLVMKNRR